MKSGFHAFGDDAQLELSSHCEDRIDEGRIIRILRCIENEAFVDFDFRERQTFQIGERRVSRAEVIQREMQARGAHGMHAADGDGKIFDGKTFRDLQGE